MRARAATVRRRGAGDPQHLSSSQGLSREHPWDEGGPDRRPAGVHQTDGQQKGPWGLPLRLEGRAQARGSPPPLHQQHHHHLPPLRSSRSGVRSAPLQQGPTLLAGNWPDALGVAAASLTQSWDNCPCLTPPAPQDAETRRRGNQTSSGDRQMTKHLLPILRAEARATPTFPCPAPGTLWPLTQPQPSGPALPSPRLAGQPAPLWTHPALSPWSSGPKAGPRASLAAGPRAR